MAFRWRVDDGQAFNVIQGIRTCIARKPYIFVIFQGGHPPLDPSILDKIKLTQNVVYKNIQQDKGLKLFIYLIKHNHAEPGYICFDSVDPDQLRSQLIRDLQCFPFCLYIYMSKPGILQVNWDINGQECCSLKYSAG